MRAGVHLVATGLGFVFTVQQWCILGFIRYEEDCTMAHTM